MDGYLGDTVNDTAFGRRWVPRDLRGPAHPDFHSPAPSGPYGISTTERYRAMTGAAEVPESEGLDSQKPSSLATDLSLAAGNVVALCLERHAKYGALNISNTPGGALSGIIVRLFDKLSRLAHSGADFADESVNDTINDIVGYGLIASLVVNNKWPTK